MSEKPRGNRYKYSTSPPAVSSSHDRSQWKDPFEFDAQLCASFPATAEQLDILEEIEIAGGSIDSATILERDGIRRIGRIRARAELQRNRFIASFGDSGRLDGFEITPNGRALLQRLRPITPDEPQTSAPLGSGDLPEVDAQRTPKNKSGKSFRPWDANCVLLAKTYIEECVAAKKVLKLRPFIKDELAKKNGKKYPNAKMPATIVHAFVANETRWKPALIAALATVNVKVDAEVDAQRTQNGRTK